ncbi:MAG: coenzyme F420-0:L-glutamate ligase, partial [Clostridia bacterium]|nr:coenzyme F420-0:L-glutamate ligase [Clostridia bacterium]
MRTTGVIARGILTPILKQGDDLVQIVTDCLMRSAQCDGYSLQDGDIIGVTEAVVGRTQGNYATCEQIAQALQAQFKPGPLGLVFPILSRNRFSILLKAMAIAAERLFILLSYPADEVGNELVPHEAVAQKGVNPYSGCLTEPEFRGLFGWDYVHPFTGVDYIQLYKEFGPHIEILFSNDPLSILTYTRQVLCCDIHTRER